MLPARGTQSGLGGSYQDKAFSTVSMSQLAQEFFGLNQFELCDKSKRR
jgi:hypothetical protein